MGIFSAYGKQNQSEEKLNDDVLFGEVWNRTNQLFLWDRSWVTVTALLAQGFRQSYKSKKKCYNYEEKQLVFENTHEAIIDADTWERVQELRKNKRRPTRTGKTNLFSGIVRCADCGEKLYYCTSKNFEARQGIPNEGFLPFFVGKEQGRRSMTDQSDVLRQPHANLCLRPKVCRL